MSQPVFDRSRRRVLKAMAGSVAVASSLGFPAVVRAQQDTLKFGHLTPRTDSLASSATTASKPPRWRSTKSTRQAG